MTTDKDKKSMRANGNNNTKTTGISGVQPPCMFLESVKLERFKAAFRPDPLSLSPFAVLIGRNGSGKSTVLEALQWLDIALRHDAVRACERYSGIHDLLNVRSRSQNTRYFKLFLDWSEKEERETPAGKQNRLHARYEVRVNESVEGRPLIHSESLFVTERSGDDVEVIRTDSDGDRKTAGTRLLFPGDHDRQRMFDEPDRLALSRLSGGTYDGSPINATLEAIRRYWEGSVFLRLSPHRIAQGSPARRRSFDPLLDEEGQSLPALLNELTTEQNRGLMDAMKTVLPDVRDITVTGTNSTREQNIYWSIREKMPTGYAGTGTYEIPACMLSEGTRRLTAILALLMRRPPPSLLCIEEIENGLDPWTVLNVLAKLRGAPRQGTQIVLTSHSPWLLDHVELDAIRYVNRTGGNTRHSVFRSESAKRKFLASVPPGAQYVNLDQG